MLALNILLSFSLSAELADTFTREIFGIPADTLSDLIFIYSLSIVGQIDWHAWFTSEAWQTVAFGFQCVDFVSTHLMARPVGLEAST